MSKHDEIRIKHMLDAVEEALTFVRNRDREHLDQDRMLVLALIKDIEIVGEAASRISDETKQAAPDIPWANITGMRNRLIHAYFDINLDILWQTVSKDLPELSAKLNQVIKTVK
jgi:uncharacterized protein with HEPN domain